MALELTQDYVRYWPQTWLCTTLNDDALMRARLSVKREGYARTSEEAYVVESSSSPGLLRWHGKLSWKLRASPRQYEEVASTLVVNVEYEQPSVARFDTFVDLMGTGVRAASSRVLNEAASEACLNIRNDCRHTEEVVLLVPRSALRSAMRTGLLIDLIGHGRTERLAIPKEDIVALGERAQVR